VNVRRLTEGVTRDELQRRDDILLAIARSLGWRSVQAMRASVLRVMQSR
jgi:hypothetical protein